MEQRLFIYSRTKYFDYRLLATPKDEFITDKIRWEFIEFVRQVINTDNPLNGEIDTIRWSFYKIDNYILWGIGCNNSDLSNCCYDKVGTPVRGFFGFIIKLTESEDLSLVYDLDYFRELYSAVIVPIWEVKDEKTVNNNNSVFIPKNIDGEYIHPNKEEMLNAEKSKCCVFPITEDLKLLVGSAFSYTTINFVSGLNRPGHAVESCFMNSISMGCDKKQTFHLSNTSKSAEEDKDKNCSQHKLYDERTKDAGETQILILLLEKAILLVNNLANKFNVCANDLIDEIRNRLQTDEKKSNNVNRETKDNIDVFTCRKASKEKIQQLKEDYLRDKAESYRATTESHIGTAGNVANLEEISFSKKLKKDKTIEDVDVVNDFQTNQQLRIRDPNKDRINFIRERADTNKKDENSSKYETTKGDPYLNQNKDNSDKI